MRIFLISWFLAYSFIGKAQNKQNVFIQSNPSQLFFAELNGISQSSNTEGFILLSNLDSLTSLVISFPNPKNEQYKFNFEDKKTNPGYFLQQTIDNSWQLIDYSGQTFIAGIKIDNHQKNLIDSSNFAEDIFSIQLANAVNDQDIRDVAYIIKTERSQLPTTINQPNGKNNTISIGSEVKLIYQDSYKMVFVDKTKKQVDTVIITFDNVEANSNLTAIKKDSSVNNSVTTIEDNMKDKLDSLGIQETIVKLDADSSSKKIEVAENQQDISIIIRDSSVNNSSLVFDKTDSVQLDEIKTNNQIIIKDSSSVVEPQQILETKKKVGKFIPNEVSSKIQSHAKDTVIEIKNSNIALTKDTLVQAKRVNKLSCKVEANERDFILFRRKMILMNNQKELLFFASKEFKQKCYTTLLVRNLSFIFLNDNDKFQFFKLAYSNVLDPENFGTLERFLVDEQEILKFKNLINNQ